MEAQLLRRKLLVGLKAKSVIERHVLIFVRLAERFSYSRSSVAHSIGFVEQSIKWRRNFVHIFLARLDH